MSLPILERFESEQTAARVNRENQHIQSLAKREGEATTDKATAGAATKEEREHPIYTPPVTVGIPGFETAAKASAAAAPAPSFKQLGELPGNTVKAAEEDANEAKKNVFGWAEGLGKLLSNLLEGSFWVRVFKFIAGGVLLILALVFFAKAATGGGGETAPGLSTTRQVGSALASPAKAAGSIAGKAASGQGRRARRRQSTVSPARRKAVEEGRAREAKREPEKGKSGKPLSGGALKARERSSLAKRAAILAAE